MSIVEIPIKPMLTPARALKQIKTMNYNMCIALDKMHKQIYDFFWEQPDPMAILIEAGVDAKALWDSSSAIQELLKSSNPTYVELVPAVTPTFNEDGTVVH